MGEKALWPAVAVIGLLGGFITAMLIAGVEVVSIIAVFSLMSGVLNVMLYGKLQKIENNTNGAMSDKDAMIKDLVDTIKRSPAVNGTKE